MRLKPVIWVATRKRPESGAIPVSGIQGLVRIPVPRNHRNPERSASAARRDPPSTTGNSLIYGLAANRRFGTVSKGKQWLWRYEWSVNDGCFTTPSFQPGAAGPPSLPRARSFSEDAL